MPKEMCSQKCAGRGDDDDDDDDETADVSYLRYALIGSDTADNCY